MKMTRFGLILVSGLCLSTSLLAQRSEIRQGNSEYESKNFGNAESSYRKALEKDPALFAGKYNLGNALYRQDKMEDAARYYMESSTGDRSASDQSRALYNMGNALMKNEKYQEATEAYKQALKLDTKDEDARYNLSYALQKLRQQQQEQQQQQNQQDKQKKDSNKDQQQQQQQKNQQQKDQQQQQQQQQQQGNKQDQQRKMSKEEAERMLKALRNDEKELQKEKSKKIAAPAGAPLKNW